MSYLFTGLVIINALVLGYFMFLHEPQPTASVQQAKAELSQPIDFQNSSSEVPPLIGTEK
ncbi:hypothetical protein [Psychrobacter sp. I-STPA6b]|uniref:hypothetical protein n=1 Tax=Psychrobacter sp. I-STPA6b TaxID=2585718 RepID=UPI001D0C6F57|nr:hypothetical protein [Psychrobacter sp. I-STPA6b]